MTRTQTDTLINRAHDILDRDGLVSIKFVFTDLEMKLINDDNKNKSYDDVISNVNNSFYHACLLDRVNRKFDKQDFVIISVGKSTAYDAHEFLGMILSDMIFIGPDKAFVI